MTKEIKRYTDPVRSAVQVGRIATGESPEIDTEAIAKMEKEAATKRKYAKTRREKRKNAS